MKRPSGFTIVELLVVVTIIVVLATITVFAFGSWRERTSRSQIKNEISSANAAIQHYANFNNAFPADTATLKTLYQADGSLATTYTLRVDGKSYCLQVVDNTGANLATQYYDSATGNTSTTVCS